MPCCLPSQNEVSSKKLNFGGGTGCMCCAFLQWTRGGSCPTHPHVLHSAALYALAFEFNAGCATGQIKNKHICTFICQHRIFGNHRCLSMFMDVYLGSFHFPALLGEGFGLSCRAFSWILVNLGVCQLQLEPNAQKLSLVIFVVGTKCASKQFLGRHTHRHLKQQHLSCGGRAVNVYMGVLPSQITCQLHSALSPINSAR